MKVKKRSLKEAEVHFLVSADVIVTVQLLLNNFNKAVSLKS